MVEHFLARLEVVHQVGPNRWKARCPAHDDRRPSLSIAVTEDGKILIHCFAGCDTGDVLAALGLGWGDLFLNSKSKGSKKWLQRKTELALAKAYRKLHQQILNEIADEIKRIEKVFDAGGWLLAFEKDCPEWIVEYVHRLSTFDGVWWWLFTNKELPLPDFAEIWQILKGAKNDGNEHR